MQITRESSAGNLIRAVEDRRVLIGEQWLTGHLVVTGDRILRDWAPGDPARLGIGDFEAVLACEPELIIVGSAGGEPDIVLMQALAEYAVGLELMRRAAACRTFNVLLHEGRKVALALIDG